MQSNIDKLFSIMDSLFTIIFYQMQTLCKVHWKNALAPVWYIKASHIVTVLS